MDDYNRRIMYRDSRPNPLFEDWIGELLAEAVEKNSRLEPMLRQALDSIKKYPLRLESGADCAILKGFHKKLCSFLDYRFAVYESIIAEELEEERAQAQNTADIDERGNIIYEGTVSSSNTESDTAFTNVNNNDTGQGTSNALPDYRDISSAPSRTELLTLQQHPARAATISEQIRKTLALNSKPQNKDSFSSNGLSSSYEDPIAGPSSAPVLPQPGPSTSYNLELAGPSTSNGTKSRNRKVNENYKPDYRTVSYAIILALYEYLKVNPTSLLTKLQIAKLAQKHCDESLFLSDTVKCNTQLISTNLTRLIKKGFVLSIKQRKIEYRLTKEGLKLAEQLLNEGEENDMDTVNTVFPISDVVSNVDELTDNETASASPIAGEMIEFPAGSYDIILLIDKNETSGASNKDDPTVAQFNKYPRLKHEYRSLKVGDFTWIAQHHVTKQELVLPCIIERKRMDDLAASIKDGRFHEQKFRLHKCGITTVIYMVEAYGKNKNLGLPLQSLRQALANTRVHDGYKILASNSLCHTVRLLAVMTNKMLNDYKDKPLKGRDGGPRDGELQTYQFFSKVAAKNKALNVNGLFLKQLLQLKGLSVEKALAISKVYPTPHLLVEEYKKLTQSQGEMLLANLKYGDTGRNVGPIVSKTVYELFTQRVEE